MSTAVLKQPSDADLVAASRAGDQEAFGAIVTRYQGLVSGFIYNRCRGDILRSEELSQETFITAWQNLTGLKDPNKLGTWLCGIARNIVNSTRRREARKGSTEPICETQSDVAAPPEEAISREQQLILWQSLERVPETYREPMVMFYRHGQSVTEVARVLELKEATVRKRLERGRSLLRDQIASFVEDSLKRTAPNAAFTVAVLAALPAMSSKATAATFGAGVVAGAGGSKLLVFLASFLGPIMAIVGGCYGAITSVRQTRTPRERRFIIRRIIVLTLVIFGFWGLQYGLYHFREVLPPDSFVPLNTASWVLFATFIAIYSWLQHGANMQMTAGPPDTVPHVSLWAANILLLAIGVMMLTPILLTKDFATDEVDSK